MKTSARYAKASMMLTLGALALLAPVTDGVAGNSCGPGSADPATGVCNCPGGYVAKGTPGHSRCEPLARPQPTATAKPTATTKPTTTTAPTTTAPPKLAGNRSVTISGGSFLMGSSGADDKDADPPHLVTVSSYQIDAYEVSVSDYDRCVSAGVCKKPPATTDTDCNYGSARTDHPMNCVTWPEAQTYCTWQKKRLPSEAEWEFAARGPKGNEYPWGAATPTCQYANFTAASTATPGCGLGTSPVGTHPAGATAAGVYDLAGNVEEWTLDLAARFNGVPGADPGGPISGTQRVVKGGSWDLSSEHFLHGAHREFMSPEERQNWLGFRCAAGTMPLPNAFMYRPLSTSSSPSSPPAPMAPSDPDAMISMQGGEFTMGDPAQQNASPAHRVWVTAFSIDKYEVTAKRYAACVNAGVCGAPVLAEPECTYGKVGKESYPINCVTWDEARSFCAWTKKRLPTEAEWEFAARGPSTRTFPWGNDAATCARANFKGCAGGPAMIGQRGLGISYFGVHDMSGNVDEWVKDWSGPYAAGASVDPSGPASGTKRVIRGGNWKEELGLQSFARWSSDRATTTIGFRCAKTGT